EQLATGSTSHDAIREEPVSACRAHGPSDLLRGVSKVVGTQDLEAGLGHDLLAEVDVRALQTYDQRHRHTQLPSRGNHAFRDDIAAHDAAEYIDQNALNVRVVEDDFEGGRDLLLGSGATDIKEVGGFHAVQLDDVHGGHGEAGTIDETADLAVELHVGEIVFRRLDL